MSAFTAIDEQHAAKEQRLTLSRDEAASRLRKHEDRSEAQRERLTKIEADFVENATMEALGLEPTRDLPDAKELEKIKADVAVAEPVRRKLASSLEAWEEKLLTARSEHKAAIATHLKEVAVGPALERLQEAFDVLHSAASA